MAEATKTTIHLDELRDYAVRDLSKLTPGSEVIFVHLPVLGHPELQGFKQSVSGYLATVIEVREATFAELYPSIPTPVKTDTSPVIFHQAGIGESVEGAETYSYAADSGVIPYGGSEGVGYNSTNFTVLLSELEEKGLTPVLEVTEEYAAKLAEDNEQIVVDSYYYDDYGWDDEPYGAGVAEADPIGPAPVLLDELRNFSVETVEELIPGAEVFIVHIPFLGSPEIATQKAEPWLVQAELIELKEATFKELHPRAPGFEGDSAKLVIRYRRLDDRKDAQPLYSYASIFGLDPAEKSTAALSDFIVLASTLEEYGLRADTELSRSYAERLAGYNAQVRVFSSGEDDGYWKDGLDDY